MLLLRTIIMNSTQVYITFDHGLRYLRLYSDHTIAYCILDDRAQNVYKSVTLLQLITS